MPASSGGDTVATQPPERLTSPHPSRRAVISWAVWDCGGAAFNAVVTTFIFTVYLTGSSFVDPTLVAARLAEIDPTGPAHRAMADAEATLSSGLGWGIAVASLIVALVAPVLGQRSDASGRRKLWLGVNPVVSSSRPACSSSFEASHLSICSASFSLRRAPFSTRLPWSTTTPCSRRYQHRQRSVK